MPQGVNTSSVFTKTNPGTVNVPTVAGGEVQDGYDIRAADRVGVKVWNATDVVVAYRVLGYSFEDTSLAQPLELVASTNVAVGAGGFSAVDAPGLAKVHVELVPAGAATGDVKVVLGLDSSG